MMRELAEWSFGAAAAKPDSQSFLMYSNTNLCVSHNYTHPHYYKTLWLYTEFTDVINIRMYIVDSRYTVEFNRGTPFTAVCEGPCGTSC